VQADVTNQQRSEVQLLKQVSIILFLQANRLQCNILNIYSNKLLLLWVAVVAAAAAAAVVVVVAAAVVVNMMRGIIRALVFIMET
jgi:hypothetical protein